MMVLDTNILIEYFSNTTEVVDFIEKARQDPYEQLGVSVITEVELFASPDLHQGEEVSIERFLATITVLDIRHEVARAAAVLRKTTSLALGDALIVASAQVRNATLVTRDKQMLRVVKDGNITKILMV